MSVFDKQLIIEQLKANDIFCLFFDCLPSTNTYLKELCKSSNISSDSVIFAREQSQGRGRRQNSFASPRDKGIYMSYLIRCPQLCDYVNFAPFAALIVYRELEKLGVENLQLKWPNDILVNGKKICGILVEGVSYNNCIIVGIGLNVYTGKINFPHELQGFVTSLTLEKIKNVDISDLAVKLALGVKQYQKSYVENYDLLYEEYKTKLDYVGKDLSIMQGDRRIKGRFESINKDGSLVIIEENGNKVVVNYGVVIE